MFEKTLAQAARGEPEVQSLLEPAVVELDDAGMELIRAHSETILDGGSKHGIECLNGHNPPPDSSWSRSDRTP